jgi:hypothetical protein
MKYTVTASYITNCVAEVTANNADEAYQIARDMDGGEFSQTRQDDWKIQNITLSDANFTDEQLAFTEAYLSNVASADRDTVKKFLLAKDHDTFCEEHGDEYYTGLADARGVWYDAKIFFAKELLNKFNTGEKSE